MHPLIGAVMTIHYGLEKLRLKNPVVTLGTFDGVHKGHRALLDYLVTRSSEVNGESVAVTFDPHPRLVLSNGGEGIFFLTSLDEKKILLEETGIDHLLILKFTKALSNLEACDFVKKILVDKIGVSFLIVGYDHHFGKNRQGNFDAVSECAKIYDFKVEQIKEVICQDGIISSTAIREALLSGHPELAARMLGYSYSISGKIIKGRKIGRDLGFPTANIKPSCKYKLIPSSGVYAVNVQVDGRVFKGMLSIGVNPTVNNSLSERSIEVNIFDFNQNIYGSKIKVSFVERMRDEIKFDSMEQLTSQMKLDRELALKILSGT